MKGCSVNSERWQDIHSNCNSGQIGLHIHKDSQNVSEKSWKTAPWSLNLHSAISGDVHSLFWVPYVLRWQGMWR